MLALCESLATTLSMLKLRTLLPSHCNPPLICNSSFTLQLRLADNRQKPWECLASGAQRADMLITSMPDDWLPGTHTLQLTWSGKCDLASSGVTVGSRKAQP